MSYVACKSMTKPVSYVREVSSAPVPACISHKLPILASKAPTMLPVVVSSPSGVTIEDMLVKRSIFSPEYAVTVISLDVISPDFAKILASPAFNGVNTPFSMVPASDGITSNVTSPASIGLPIWSFPITVRETGVPTFTTVSDDDKVMALRVASAILNTRNSKKLTPH